MFFPSPRSFGHMFFGKICVNVRFSLCDLGCVLTHHGLQFHQQVEEPRVTDGHVRLCVPQSNQMYHQIIHNDSLRKKTQKTIINIPINCWKNGPLFLMFLLVLVLNDWDGIKWNVNVKNNPLYSKNINVTCKKLSRNFTLSFIVKLKTKCGQAITTGFTKQGNV